jgi:hypothetical protein
VNSIGESDQSVQIHLIAATYPDVLAAPLMVAADKTYITINWVYPLYDGGDEVDDYQLDWKLSASPSWPVTVFTTGNLTYYTIGGL